MTMPIEKKIVLERHSVMAYEYEDKNPFCYSDFDMADIHFDCEDKRRL